MTTLIGTTAQLYYTCEFDVTSQTALTCVVNTSHTATVAARDSYIWDSQIVTHDSALANFGVALVIALNAAVADATWSVAFNSTNHLVISRSTTFTIDWTGTSGTRLRDWLGFTANLSGAASYTATHQPYYYNEPAIYGRTGYSDVYEADGGEITQTEESDGGAVHSVALNTAVMWNDWAQAAESYTATFDDAALTAYAITGPQPWTWQSLFTYVRGFRNVYVWRYTDLVYTVHRLRPQGSNFRPDRMVKDDNTYWIVNFKTYQLEWFKP